MFILKGKRGKSKLVEILLSYGESICISINDYFPYTQYVFNPEYGTFLTNRDIENLLSFILVHKLMNEHQYIIIYTNFAEGQLESLITSLIEFKNNYSVLVDTEFIITCKE